MLGEFADLGEQGLLLSLEVVSEYPRMSVLGPVP